VSVLPSKKVTTALPAGSARTESPVVSRSPSSAGAERTSALLRVDLAVQHGEGRGTRCRKRAAAGEEQECAYRDDHNK